MTNYKVTFLSGHSTIIEDKRSIEVLTAALCQDGFLVVAAVGTGYSSSHETLSILERTVSTITLQRSAP